METAASHPATTGPTRLVLLVIVVGTALRLMAGGLMGLGVDESYAVAAARGVSLGYFDHPPLSFWLAAGAARLAGSEARLVVRLPFILLFAGTTWLMYRLGARLFGARAGALAALLLNLSPVFAFSTGGWVLPDGPLMFSMAAAALCLARALLDEDEPHPGRWWLAAGVFTGLALLSKYHGVFLIAGTFLFLLTSPRHRGWLRRPQPYVACLVALAMFTPVLIWNAHHGWISFRFQGSRAAPGHGLHISPLLQSLGGQAGYVLPWIWAPLVWLLIRGLWRGPRHGAAWLLCWMAVGPVVVFTLPALWAGPGLPHWEAPGYLLLFPLLGEGVDRRLRPGAPAATRVRRWLAASVVAYLALLGLAVSQTATGWLEGVAPSLFRRGDPSLEALDWRDLKPALEQRALLADDRFVGATSWIDAGKVAYALGPGVPVVCVCSRPHHFAFVAPQAAWLGHDAVLVQRASAHPGVDSTLAGDFGSIAPAGAVTIHRAGRPALELRVYLARDFTRAVPRAR
jgi:4-amino-4-deoxy-L-arabinose transferase-like glycosyltransferase